MNEIEIRTKAEFRAALKLPNTLLDLIEGAYDLTTRATEAPVLRVRAGASLRIEACESSQPRMVAHPNPAYPTKIKARRVAKPIYEVDEDGERIT